MLTSSQLVFHFCPRPAHHKSFYQELHGPAVSMTSGVKISYNQSWQCAAEPSRDSLGSRVASSCRFWARDSMFAFQQWPHQPNDEGWWIQKAIPVWPPHLVPIPIPIVGQPVPIRLNGNSSWMWPWGVPECWRCTHSHVPGHSSAPDLPSFPWPSSMLGNWIMAPLIHSAFHFDFAGEAVKESHLSLPCLLRQLPTYQRAELTSLELLASNPAKQQKYPGTLKNRKCDKQDVFRDTQSTFPICTQKA